MAISTIAQVFNNPNVFKTNVKIRKGLAVKLIMEATTIENVQNIFMEVSNLILSKAKPTQTTFFPVSIWYGQLKSSIAAGKFTGGATLNPAASFPIHPATSLLLLIAILAWVYRPS
ncbi:bifunctional farnesyl-diphosphate farnesyltransferase/squalene synthase [Massospora cicadina]|nr:bifunctional farnesyl-diphosphate farnesyltransferase/squalene synthase [Massospora cicadina]